MPLANQGIHNFTHCFGITVSTQLGYQIRLNKLALIRIARQDLIPVSFGDPLFIKRLLGPFNAISLGRTSADNLRSGLGIVHQVQLTHPGNSFLRLLSLRPVHIIGTEGAVVIGMVYDYFPYMILPIYSVMAKMDVRLEEAARDLGCNSFGVLRRVIFPLSLPGVISGVTMVLIPSISTFYISQKLGNGKFYLIGDAIEGQYVANNLHFAAAIAFILMVILLVGMALMQRFANSRAAA